MKPWFLNLLPLQLYQNSLCRSPSQPLFNSGVGFGNEVSKMLILPPGSAQMGKYSRYFMAAGREIFVAASHITCTQTCILGKKHRCKASYRQQDNFTILHRKLKLIQEKKSGFNLSLSGFGLLFTLIHNILVCCFLVSSKCSVKFSMLMNIVKSVQKSSCFVIKTLVGKKS